MSTLTAFLLKSDSFDVLVILQVQEQVVKKNTENLLSYLI